MSLCAVVSNCYCRGRPYTQATPTVVEAAEVVGEEQNGAATTDTALADAEQGVQPDPVCCVSCLPFIIVLTRHVVAAGSHLRFEHVHV